MIGRFGPGRAIGVQMAIIIEGKTICPLCGKALFKEQGWIAFPAFLRAGHKFFDYSDAAFHSECFMTWKDHEEFQTLYDRFQEIWKERPRNVPWQEAMEWHKHAFDELDQGPK